MKEILIKAGTGALSILMVVALLFVITFVYKKLKGGCGCGGACGCGGGKKETPAAAQNISQAEFENMIASV